MSIEHIETLCKNPHFHALLLQGFLSGYKKPCEVRVLLMALPILMYSDSRKKLVKATTRSRMDTLFSKPEELENGTKISGRVKLSGYIERFKATINFSKKSLIILSSERKIILKEKKIFLIKEIKYSDYKGVVREWVRAAYYLGVVFAKSNEEYLNYFLGVDRT